ncbi:hypothetical protein EDC96DRAFT_586836 [Choanephora cucurbitarum]|nr:hypothetical protein EDC96DRAFT_586836 [Choanephora cucurbitarum]
MKVRHTDDLLRSLFVEMQEMRQAMGRMSKDCTCNGHRRRNRATDFKTDNAYCQTLCEDVSRRNKRDLQAWFNDIRGNRVCSTIKTGSFKQKAMHVAKRYINAKTSWDLTGQALEDQANRMYHNTRYIAHGFCSRHINPTPFSNRSSNAFAQYKKYPSQNTATQNVPKRLRCHDLTLNFPFVPLEGCVNATLLRALRHTFSDAFTSRLFNRWTQTESVTEDAIACLGYCCKHR